MLLPQHIVCIQYVILFFSFCQHWLLLRTIKEIKCTLQTTKHGTLCRFYYGLFTHNENAKTGHSFCYILFFMAESEGFFGVLPYSFASLRSLTTDFQTVHRTVFIGKADRSCSNPLLSYQQKNKGYSKRYTLYSWRRVRDSAHFVRPRVCTANYPIIDFF